MAPLALVCLALAGLCAYKALWLWRVSRKDAGRVQAARWAAGEAVNAANPHGAATWLVRVFLARRTGEPKTDRGILHEIRRAMDARVDDWLAPIGVLAAIAPLLGLLGTVLGMTAAFDVLSVFGTGNARAMAASISEALVTTETGLLIAIPGVYMKGFLDRRAEQVKTRLSRIVIHLEVHALQAKGPMP
ncbi:MAG: MotA/TolQ/ExbB proton channel family protein [Desulfatibacillaceae bacterium]